MKKIAFHSNQLGIRGTEVALFNYAKYNEEILGNKSVIFTFPNRDMGAYQKFADRFDVVIIEWWEYEKYLTDNGFDYLYLIKMGINDGYSIPSIKTLIHVVFRFNDPHGYKYFYVSDWLAKDQGYNPETHSLPHICERLPYTNINMKEELGIPTSSKVFGCYGGSTEFNIEFVKQTIRKLVRNNDNVYFLFMNINEFDDHPQVKFLPGSYDLMFKSKFVNTCDYMLHARSGGETFGLAISEFALSNKPIITYGLSGEKSHIEILGDYGIYYNNMEDLEDILVNTEEHVKYEDYTIPYLQFSPEKIMDKFNQLL
jgi:hypothetical protein